MNKKSKQGIMLATTALGVSYGVAHYFYGVAIKRKNHAHSVIDENHHAYKDNQALLRTVPNNLIRDIFVTAFDGLKLHAKSYVHESTTHKWVIVVHGYGSHADEMAVYILEFYKMGYNVLAVDCRGHGQSEGNYIGMGWKDRLDVISWIDYLVSCDNDAEVALFGTSMGGATVMMTSGEALPDNVKLVIEDCGYTSVFEQFNYRMKIDYKNVPTRLVLGLSKMLILIRAGYNIKSASALEQVKKSNIPMLFIHGDDDSFVPYSMHKVLYDAAVCKKDMFIFA